MTFVLTVVLFIYFLPAVSDLSSAFSVVCCCFFAFLNFLFVMIKWTEKRKHFLYYFLCVYRLRQDW